MPLTLIQTDKIIRTGTPVGPGSEVDADPVDGNAYRNTGSELIVVRNSGLTDHTVAVEVTVDVDGIAVPDRVVTIPAGKSMIFGPLPADVYNQNVAGVSGIVKITGSDAELKFQVLRPQL